MPATPSAIGDIGHYRDLLYVGGGGEPDFRPAAPSTRAALHVDEPVLIVDPLHSCYGHGLLDSAVSIFFAMEDLRHAMPHLRDFRILVRARLVRQFPRQNLAWIDSTAATYRGAYGDLLAILTPHPVIFEHLLPPGATVFLRECFTYPMDDRWQRSIWNSRESYPGRPVPPSSVRFADDVLYARLTAFRDRIVSALGLERAKAGRLVLIERRLDRWLGPALVNQILKHTRDDTPFACDGVTFPEDLSFLEQVRLFSAADAVVGRHGSALANLLWIPDHAMVVEIDDVPGRREIFRRLSRVSHSTHHTITTDQAHGFFALRRQDSGSDFAGSKAGGRFNCEVSARSISAGPQAS